MKRKLVVRSALMKNKGMHQNRFAKNFLEKVYAKAWEEINLDDHDHGILEYLLAENNSRPQHGEVTDRDRVVAATVIQWLGSAVGQSFLMQLPKE